jgi:hypothetical protein
VTIPPRADRAAACAILVTLLVVPDMLRAQQVGTSRDVGLTFRGFLSGSLFVQDARFGLGNGQQAEFVAAELDEWWHGGDVRNARLALDFRGPTIADDWRTAATLEIDFFGPFSGTGNFSDEQPTPRLRLAYVDLSKGGTRLRVGQDWALTLGIIPTSVGHLGFPLGWGSGGFIGWRFPGIWVQQRLTPERSDLRAVIQFAVLRGSWSDEPAPDGPSAGEAGIPQLEARLDVGDNDTPAAWNLYVVGHWDRKDLSGVGPGDDDDELDSWALQAGGALRPGPLTLQGNAYTGQAMGHHFAHIIQFGDIGGWGGWVQAGVDLTRRWSLWAYGGMDDPDDGDVVASDAERVRSWLLVPMLRYANGPYSLGLEWLHNRTDYEVDDGRDERSGNQLMLSVRFDF